MFQVEITEKLGRYWDETLIKYRVKASIDMDANPILLKNGVEIPCQIANKSPTEFDLYFFSDLKPNSTDKYELVPGNQQFTSLVSQDKISNGIMGLTFNNINFSGDELVDKIQAPIKSLHNKDLTFGGSQFRYSKQDYKIKSVSTKVTENGPLFAEVLTIYNLNNDGYYKFKARVYRDKPFIHIFEEADVKINAKPSWFLQLDISSGWNPRNRFWFSNGINGQWRDRDPAFEAQLQSLGYDTYPQNNNIGHTKQTLVDVFNTSYWTAWSMDGGWHHYFGLVDNKNLDHFVGIMPIHAGRWRGYQQYQAFNCNVKGGKFFFNIKVSGDEVASLDAYNGPEYDPSVPKSYVRHEWLLIGGSFQYHNTLKPLRRSMGYIGLNEYKDWIL